jgi:hypothetical protein
VRKLTDGRLAIGALIAFALWIFVALPLYYGPRDDSAAYKCSSKESENYTFWEKTRCDPAAYFTIWLVGFTGVLAASTIGLWIVTWLSGVRQSRDMKASVAVAEGQLAEMQATRRPWLQVAVRINGPLTFGPPIQLPLHVVIRNVGQSPAFDAWVNISLFPTKAGLNPPAEMRKRSAEERAKNVERQSQSRNIGYTLFPDKEFNIVVTAAVVPAEYDEWRATNMGKSGHLMLYLVVCGDYRFSFAPEIHSTQSLFTVGTKIGAQQGFTNAMLRLDMGTISQDSLALLQDPFGTSYAD